MESRQEVMAGMLGHTTNPQKIALRLPNGKRVRTPKETMSVAKPHFTKQFNMQQPRYAGAAKLIAQREGMFDLDNDISFEEFKKKRVMKM